jgi:class 3 adenylate cyclase/TolB-like protein
MSERADGSVRRLAAIWFADIVGYTRLSSVDENTALLLVTVLQQLAREEVQARGGRVVKFIGDAVLAEFNSTDAALRGAIALRDSFANASAATGAPSTLRIGVHVGDVLGTSDGDLYGDSVNLASRVQGAAAPGHVCVTQDVWHQLRQRRDFRFESVGEQELKGLDKVWMFKAAMASPQDAPAPLPPAVPPASVRFARIVRLALVYGVAALILLQLTGLLSNRFELPAWVTPTGLVLLLVGFVVMVATGWVQTRSPWQRSVDEPKDPWKVDVGDLASAVRHRRVPTLTWGRALLGGALAFAVLFGAAAAYVLIQGRGLTFAPQPAGAQPASSVAILPFQATGGDAAAWGEDVVDLLALNLDGAAGMRVVDPRTVSSRWREAGEAGDSAATVRLAQDVDARWAVSGGVEVAGGQLTLRGTVYDAESGEMLDTLSVSGPQDSLPQLLDRFAIRILEAGGVRSGEGTPPVAMSRVATASTRALLEYVAGVREFRRSRWAEAQDHFLAATQADSTFAQAQFGLSLSAGWATSPHSLLADGSGDAALRHAGELPERERMLVRGYREMVRRDPRAIATLEALTERYPDDVDGWFLLGDAYYHLSPDDGRFRTALNQARALDPTFGPAYVHLMEDAARQHDVEEAQRLVSAYRTVDPNSPLLLTLDLLLEQASVVAAADAGPAPAAPAPSTPAENPARAEYTTSRQAADAARREAAGWSGQAAFASGDSLRAAALDAAAGGRYPQAMQLMEQARRAYERARSDGLAAQRADSLAAERARAQAPPTTGGDPPPARPPAAQPQPTRTAPAEEIATRVLADVQSAIEGEDLPALTAVWTNLTAEGARNYQALFDGTRESAANIETLSVDSAGSRITVRIRTTLEFYNESTRRRESTSAEHTLQLEERSGRWVIVASQP